MNNYILDLIENGVIAVCETVEEAKQAEDFWASAILLVFSRWWWESNEVEVFPSESLIKECVLSLEVPVFVRVRFWHFWEAEIAEKLWVSAIIESLRWNESLDKALVSTKYKVPIVSEIASVNELKRWQDNYLLVWDFATWNLVKLTDSLKEFRRNSDKKIFVWWWIGNPADIKILSKIWGVKWYFIWTAMFDVEDFETWDYIKEVISYIKIS